MSDCVYWAFSAHMRHLGRPILPKAKDVFDAMREIALPERLPRFQGFWSGQQMVSMSDDEFDKVAYKRWGGGMKPGFGRWYLRYTPGAVAPLILNALAAYHGLKVVAQNDAFYGGADWLAAQSQSPVQSDVISATPHLLGETVDQITLNPAIYLFLDGEISKHAQFFPELPVGKGNIVAAFQLQEVTQ